MPQLRRLTAVAAPPTLVAGVLRDTAAAVTALRRVGCAFGSPVRLLVAGDEVDVAVAGPSGRVLRCRTRITRAGAGGLASELVSGPAAGLRHVTTVLPDGAGSRVLDELSWAGPLGPVGRGVVDPVVRGFAVRMLRARAHVLRERVQRLGAAPVVVGAAIVRDGRLLAARRSYPPELAGRWELPGGGVEPGESEAAALRRECREELGTDVEVDDGPDGRVGTDLPIGDPDGGRLLRIHRARLRPGAPEPQAHEHRELRWVGPGELAALGWLDADRAVVAELRALLDDDRRGTPRFPVPDR